MAGTVIGVLIIFICTFSIIAIVCYRKKKSEREFMEREYIGLKEENQVNPSYDWSRQRYDSIALLKNMTICHAQDVWKLTQSCK